MTTEQLVNLRADLRMFAADHGYGTSTVLACNKIELRIKTLLNKRNSDAEDVRAAIMARFDADAWRVGAKK